jgi:hypothetical protein
MEQAKEAENLTKQNVGQGTGSSEFMSKEKQDVKSKPKGDGMWQKVIYEFLGKELIKEIIKNLDKIPALWVDLRDKWNGKTITVLGATASGKNSMFHMLKREDPPKEHIQTKGIEKEKTFKCSFPLPDGKPPIKFRCKGSVNVGGEEDERERFWEDAIKGTDYVFYLVDIEKLLENKDTVISRIKGDARWIASNTQHLNEDAGILVLINKVDVLVKDIDPCDRLNHVQDSILEIVKEIETIFYKMFGNNGAKFYGVSPISTLDKHLFNGLFLDAIVKLPLKKTI